MFDDGFLWNVFLFILCYVYVVALIIVSGKLETYFHFSRKASRKFLHIMIGNLPLVVPFFTWSIFPALVAGPFILVTFLASSYSPIKGVSKRMKGLAGLTEEGHRLGLVFYAISYTFLALLFADRPYVIAAGVLPMAYGDAAASLVGEKFGKKKYKLFATKSLEGSVGMFFFSFVSLTLALCFFSVLYSFPVSEKIGAALVAAVFATLVESLSLMGSDNLTVPAFSVLAFLAFGGGA